MIRMQTKHCHCRRYTSCLEGPSKQWLADQLHRSCSSADISQQNQPDLSKIQQQVNAHLVSFMPLAQIISTLPEASVH